MVVSEQLAHLILSSAYVIIPSQIVVLCFNSQQQQQQLLQQQQQQLHEKQQQQQQDGVTILTTPSRKPSSRRKKTATHEQLQYVVCCCVVIFLYLCGVDQILNCFSVSSPVSSSTTTTAMLQAESISRTTVQLRSLILWAQASLGVIISFGLTKLSLFHHLPPTTTTTTTTDMKSHAQKEEAVAVNEIINCNDDKDNGDKYKRQLNAFMSYFCHEIRNPLFLISSQLTFLKEGDVNNSTYNYYEDNNNNNEAKDGCLLSDNFYYPHQSLSSVTSSCCRMFLSSPLQKQCWAAVNQSTEFMLRLVDDVLDLSRLEKQGSLCLKETTFDLRQLLDLVAFNAENEIRRRSDKRKQQQRKQAAAAAVSQAPQQCDDDVYYELEEEVEEEEEESDVEFRCLIDDNLPQLVVGDADRLLQIVYNLLRNANLCTTTGYIEFRASCDFAAKQHPVVQPKTSCSNSDNDCCDDDDDERVMLQLELQDTGCDRSPQSLRRLLEPNSWMETLSQYREDGGQGESGLGLAIVSNVVQSLGGTITVERGLEQGSTFRVRIPIRTTRTTTTNAQMPVTTIDLQEQRELEMVEEEGMLEAVKTTVTDTSIAEASTEEAEKSAASVEQDTTNDHKVSSIIASLPNEESNNHCCSSSRTKNTCKRTMNRSPPPRSQLQYQQQLKKPPISLPKLFEDHSCSQIEFDFGRENSFETPPSCSESPCSSATELTTTTAAALSCSCSEHSTGSLLLSSSSHHSTTLGSSSHHSTTLRSSSHHSTTLRSSSHHSTTLRSSSHHSTTLRSSSHHSTSGYKFPTSNSHDSLSSQNTCGSIFLGSSSQHSNHNSSHHRSTTTTTTKGAKQQQQQQQNALQSSPNTNVILCVDDNVVNRKLLGRMLSFYNLEYKVAEDGQVAVDMMKTSRNVTRRAEDTHYGLIIMDINMPVMDGCEATRTIRQELLLKDLPIVALTANTTQESLMEALTAGASEVRTKPILRQALHGLCETYLTDDDDEDEPENMENEEGDDDYDEEDGEIL